MKRIFPFLLALAAVASAQTSPCGPALTSASTQSNTAPAQTPAKSDVGNKAKDIVMKSIAALGGEAYLKIFDIEQKGRGFGFYRNTPAGVGITYTRYYQYPDKERYDFFKDGDWVIIHNGDKGYETTFRGTRAEGAKDLADYNRRRQYALDVVLREWVRLPGTAFFYEGQTMVETRQVHKIGVLNPQNVGVTLFISMDSFLPVKRSFTYRDPQTKAILEEAELYDGFREVQGIQTPFLLTRTKNDKIVSQRFLKSVVYNSGVGDARFKPPALDYDKLKK